MPGTIIYSDNILVTETCCNCGIAFAMPQDFHDRAIADHSRSFYCPSGHSQHFIGETPEQREKRLRRWAEDQAASERARADQAEASLRSTKGHVTRLRKRVTAGACPFGCKRHFTNLERHVASCHPNKPLEGE